MAFRGRFILNTIYFASKRGADKAALIALSGHSEAVLEKENTIVDDQTYNAIIAYAVAQTANPFFGLHLGESQNLAAAGLMLQIIQSSKTVKQALGYVCHFSNLGCDALPMQLEEEKFYYKLSLRPSELWQQQSPLAVEQTAAGILTFTLRQFRNLSRAQYNPIAVHLTWDRPAIIDEYERIWNCRVEFQQAEIAIL
ncbi:MAG: AraC family transcriptional regulator ligand-binding domain-containing protein, partial [Bacteroidota bacterium]